MEPELACFVVGSEGSCWSYLKKKVKSDVEIVPGLAGRQRALSTCSSKGSFTKKPKKDPRKSFYCLLVGACSHFGAYILSRNAVFKFLDQFLFL